MGIGILAGCGDQQATAPEAVTSIVEAPISADFQRQNPNTGQATFGNLIAALNNITVNINQLQVLNDLIDTGDITISDINVSRVNIDDVTVSVVALNNALNRNDVDVTVLRNFLNNVDITITDVLTNVLTNADIAISDVVAIDVNVGTGDITIFFQ